MNALLRHVWGNSLAQDRVWAQVTGLSPRKAVTRVLMVLQAFIDDSYNENGVFVLAGFVASAEVWSKFAFDWEEILPMGTLDSSNNFHFKMSEMASSPERMERVGAFFRVIENHNLKAISIKIDLKELRRAQQRIWILGKNINWGVFANPYVFTFRCLMDGFHAGRSNFTSLIGENDRVDFILDQQSEKKIILSFWDDYIAARPEKEILLFGATPRFEDDKQFLPLQAADLWAWWTRHWYTTGAINESPKLEIPNWMGGKSDIHVLNMRLDEDHIVEAFIELIKSSDPDAAVYDSAFSGFKAGMSYDARVSITDRGQATGLTERGTPKEASED